MLSILLVDMSIVTQRQVPMIRKGKRTVEIRSLTELLMHRLHADADHVCDSQRACKVRGDPACLVFVLFDHVSVTNVITFRSTVRCRTIGKTMCLRRTRSTTTMCLRQTRSTLRFYIHSLCHTITQCGDRHKTWGESTS